jgi:Magnesium chelatase, subunit ChlI
VSKGEAVLADHQVGRVGHTGNSTAPHLHFQLMDRADPSRRKASRAPLRHTSCTAGDAGCLSSAASPSGYSAFAPSPRSSPRPWPPGTFTNPGAPRRAVPRRVHGVPARRGRGPPPAARRRTPDRHADGGGSVTFPSRFTPVAAANPCPCGFNGDATRRCICRMGVEQLLSGRSTAQLPSTCR